MKFLLKIVQGPNAGAEIALVEGLRVTLGSADSCDIVLADPTLPAEVCAIEVSADSVALTPSGAAPETLAPFHVRSFGSTAIAVGPAESPWEPLVWAPSPEAAADAPENAGADDAAPAPAEREKAPANEEGGAAPADNDASDAEPRPAAKSRRRGLVAVLVALLAILLLVLLGAALWRASRAKAPSPAVEEAPIDPRARLEGLATDLGLVVIETNGAILVRGDFATRAERLAATAALYEARPGVALDLADRDTLLSAASDLLSAATDGALEVRDVTNRVAVLAGRVSDPAVLRSALESLRADVPRLAGADTAAVSLDSPIPAAAPPSGVTATSAPRPSQAAARRAPPRLPLCGILLQPYPCLVLQDGRRLAVGAELSGYKIVEIAPDRIRVRGGDEEEIEWTP